MNRRLKYILKKGYVVFKNYEQKRDYNQIKYLVGNMQNMNVFNEKPQKVQTIAFIVSGILSYGGGSTSILRIATRLSKYGYRVLYVAYGSQTRKEMENAAKINLEDYQGEFVEKKDVASVQADIVIATNWKSVYFSLKIPGYKMYFIQDYEPYFYELGDYYFLAKYTYEMGLHMVSLGSWNKKVIVENIKNTSIKIDTIDFPYEADEYKFAEREFSKYERKKSISIAIYIKSEPKRLPLIIQHMMGRLKEKFQHDGKELNVMYFGCEKSFPIENGKNMGKLTKKELNELYHSADFGMVASMTNISLVPFEMIATGLPVIEFKEGSFLEFFPENCAILTDFDSDKLYKNIRDACDNWEKIKEQQLNALNYIKDLSWDKSGEQFLNIIQHI